MDIILTQLEKKGMPIGQVVFFSNDEIVVEISDMNEANQILTVIEISNAIKNISIPLKIELFVLHKIEGTDGYYK